jgi:hypothetical protein
VEKLSFIFMGSNKFTKQEIKMYYLVTVNRNNLAVCLTRSDCEGLVQVMYIHCSEEDGDVRSECEEDEGSGC